jgi:hypothetical protein
MNDNRPCADSQCDFDLLQTDGTYAAPYDPSQLLEDDGPGEYPAYAPSPQDEADYREWSRAREERLWADRILEGPGFVEQLYAHANSLIDSPCRVERWLGGKVAELADLARHLEARSPESFEDRLDALKDARI